MLVGRQRRQNQHTSRVCQNDTLDNRRNRSPREHGISPRTVHRAAQTAAQVDAIKAQKDAGGLNTGAMGIGKSAVEHHDRTPTLADVGISKDLSSRAQKIASIPAPEFEEAIADHRHEREPWREAA
jgi:hypothetical protein